MKTLLVLFILTNQSFQQFLLQPEGKEVNQGEAFFLPCTVFKKFVQCRWKKDGSPLKLQKQKYELAGNLLSGDCSLTVESASAELDTGVWQCIENQMNHLCQ